MVHQQQAFGDSSGLGGGSGNQKPWSDQSGSDLARDAGIKDIGSSSSGQRADSSDNSRAGFFDTASNDDDHNDDTDHDSDGFDDDGGGDDGGSDYA